MALSVAAEMFTAMSATISGGMVVQNKVAVPESWALLLLLGFVIGWGRAWAEVRLWMSR